MSKELRIFVWDDVLVDCTGGLMFAVAGSVEEAREAIRAECNYVILEDLFRDPKIYELADLPVRVLWGGG